MPHTPYNRDVTNCRTSLKCSLSRRHIISTYIRKWPSPYAGPTHYISLKHYHYTPTPSHFREMGFAATGCLKPDEMKRSRLFCHPVQIRSHAFILRYCLLALFIHTEYIWRTVCVYKISKWIANWCSGPTLWPVKGSSSHSHWPKTTTHFNIANAWLNILTSTQMANWCYEFKCFPSWKYPVRWG